MSGNDGGGRLAGTRGMVTGGGTGIGRAIAVCLAREGAHVAVTGRRREPLEETAAAIAAMGGECFSRTMDVTDPGSVRDGVTAVAERLGGIDVLVNNAGVGGPNACALEGPERWDEIVRTNLDGVFHCTRAALPHVPDGGRIVNVSSVLGRFGVPGYTAYCASKHGVIGFTKALALEVAPRKITANAVCPGWVDTEMARAGISGMAAELGVSYEEAKRRAAAMAPLDVIVEPEEIGELVVYLASAAARSMTGQAIVLDGGQVMW